jgi:hypothetical protein
MRGEWIATPLVWPPAYTDHFDARGRLRRDSPTLRQRARGHRPRDEVGPAVESVASLSEDGATLFVMLINKSIDQAAEVRLGISGFEPAGAGAPAHRPAPDSKRGAPGSRHQLGEAGEVDPSARH